MAPKSNSYEALFDVGDMNSQYTCTIQGLDVCFTKHHAQNLLLSDNTNRSYPKMDSPNVYVFLENNRNSTSSSNDV